MQDYLALAQQIARAIQVRCGLLDLGLGSRPVELLDGVPGEGEDAALSPVVYRGRKNYVFELFTAG
jgi:hypothetical protein